MTERPTQPRDSIPDEDRVLRYCKFTSLDETGRPTSASFLLRDDESGLSVNWLEHFLGTADTQLQSAIANVRLTRRVGATARFASLEVGPTKHQLNASFSGTSGGAEIVWDPTQLDASHALILYGSLTAKSPLEIGELLSRAIHAVYSPDGRPQPA